MKNFPGGEELNTSLHIHIIQLLIQDFNWERVTKIWFSYFSTKTYVVGTQKNRLNETVLLRTQNIY